MIVPLSARVSTAFTAKLRNISIVHPWTRLLPGTSAWFGPPRRWASVADYIRATREQAWEVEPGEKVFAPAVACFGSGTARFMTNEAIVIPPRMVFRARNISVLGPDAHLVGRDDTLLWDASWHNHHKDPAAGFRDRSTSRRKHARPRRVLTGLTAALSSDWAVGSFGHFIHDALSRWRLLNMAGFQAGDFDQFVLFHPRSASSQWFIKAAGIPEERVVCYDPSVDLFCRDLVGTRLPSLPPAHPAETMRWLRELALTAEIAPHERVYLSRAGYLRHPLNSVELEAGLRDRGFYIVKSDDGMAANRACLEARIVIGVEGTNLASACFAPPGAKVIVLLPDEATFPVYPFIFSACGHTTAVVGARSGSSSQAPEFPLEQVRAALAWSGA